MGRAIARWHKAAVLAVGAVTAVCLSGIVSADATMAPPKAVRHSGAPAAFVHPDGTTCYDQRGADTGVAVLSQTFTDTGTDFSAYDSYGADDFTLAGSCRLSAVVAFGQYMELGPADSVVVTVYKDADGLPTKQVYNTTTTAVHAVAGNVTIKTKNGPKLKANVHYWLSVSVNMAYEQAGQWGWETTTDRYGSAALWENPGGGVAPQCPTWSNMRRCTGKVAGPDFMFTLRGRSTG
jgi:hypothetical protein